MTGILLVEDDPLIQKALWRMIHRQFPEAEIGSAFDVEDAISLMQHHTYDLVVCDFNLKGQKTGEDVLVWVKANRPKMRFLFLTSEERARELHPHTLAKPCSSADLLAAIRAL